MEKNILTGRIKKINEILLFLAPSVCLLMTGGFLWYQCIVPAVIFVFYLIFAMKKTDFYIIDIALSLLICWGFISVVFTKVNKQVSLYEYEKFLCFILAVYAGRKATKNCINNVFIMIAIITAIAGIAAYCNILQLNGYVMASQRYIRLQSFTQYANTTAVILGVGYLMFMEKCVEVKNKLLSCGTGIILIALYLTLSKAAIPIFIVLGTCLIWIRREYAPQFIGQNIICLLMLTPTIISASKHIYLLTMLLITITVAILTYIRNVFTWKKWIYIWSIGLICLLVAILLFAIVSETNLFNTLIKRLDYMTDAATLFKNHWFLGIGSGAWQDYQYLVQTTQYDVKYIHNGWMQYLIENGICFFAIFSALFIYALYCMRKHKEYVVMASFMLVIFHSFVDFDFSFGIVLIIVGLIIGGFSDEMSIHLKYNILSLLNVCVCIIFVAYMSAEYILRFNFEKEVVHGNYNNAQANALILERLCPYDSDLQISLADLDGENMDTHYKKAIEYAPLNTEVLEKYIVYSIDNTNDDIMELCRHYIALAPKQENTYLNAKQLAESALHKGKVDDKTYNVFLEYTAKKMKDENVVDRNDLLEQLIKTNKQ